MEFKVFVIITAVVLCSFAGNINAKLKCVQCGMSTKEMQELYPTMEKFAKLRKDMEENPEKFFCPDKLPDPTECESEKETFCIEMIQSNHSLRYCSAMKMHDCSEDTCLYSCNTDGCNVQHHVKSDKNDNDSGEQDNSGKQNNNSDKQDNNSDKQDNSSGKQEKDNSGKQDNNSGEHLGINNVLVLTANVFVVILSLFA